MSRRLPGVATVLGAAAGALLAGLLGSPVAYADPSVPEPRDFELPGSPGVPTDEQHFGFYPLLYTSEETRPWTIYDQNTGDVLGDYTTHANTLDALFLANTSVQVVDSTGTAPAVGSLWNVSDLGIPGFVGVPGQFDLFQNFYASDPTGSMQDLFQINFLSAAVIGNYFSSGPTGILDELIFFGTTVVPILDIPVTAATDAGSLWSDIAAMF